MVRGDTCPHVNRVGIMALTSDFFFFQQKAWFYSGSVRLIGSDIAVSNTLLPRRGNTACSG